MLKSREPILTMIGGKTISMINPKSEDVDFGFIDRALGRLRRFNGETLEPWSVADHSILVHDIVAEMLCPEASAKTRFCALMHDAHEAYLGDMICPVRDALATLGSGAHDFEALKAQFDQAIFGKAKIAWPLPREVVGMIRYADHVALQIEDQELRCSNNHFIKVDLRSAKYSMDQIRYEGRDDFSHIRNKLLREMSKETLQAEIA